MLTSKCDFCVEIKPLLNPYKRSVLIWDIGKQRRPSLLTVCSIKICKNGKYHQTLLKLEMGSSN